MEIQQKVKLQDTRKHLFFDDPENYSRRVRRIPYIMMKIIFAKYS